MRHAIQWMGVLVGLCAPLTLLWPGALDKPTLILIYVISAAGVITAAMLDWRFWALFAPMPMDPRSRANRASDFTQVFVIFGVCSLLAAGMMALAWTAGLLTSRVAQIFTPVSALLLVMLLQYIERRCRHRKNRQRRAQSRTSLSIPSAL